MMNQQKKKCLRCPANRLEDFGVNKRFKSGFDSICKKCRNKEAKNYRDNNSEKFKAARKLYYKNNLEQMREYATNQAHKPENIKRKREYDKKYRKNNRAKIKAYQRAWDKTVGQQPIQRLKIK